MHKRMPRGLGMQVGTANGAMLVFDLRNEAGDPWLLCLLALSYYFACKLLCMLVFDMRNEAGNLGYVTTLLLTDAQVVLKGFHIWKVGHGSASHDTPLEVALHVTTIEEALHDTPVEEALHDTPIGKGPA
eukprot:1152317-Pelagomonas_calceolata.AAC.2